MSTSWPLNLVSNGWTEDMSPDSQMPMPIGSDISVWLGSQTSIFHRLPEENGTPLSNHVCMQSLDRSENLWLHKLPSLDHLAAGVGVGCLAVGLEQLGHVQFGCLQDLGLSDIDVVQWVNALDETYELLHQAFSGRL